MHDGAWTAIYRLGWLHLLLLAASLVSLPFLDAPQNADSGCWIEAIMVVWVECGPQTPFGPARELFHNLWYIFIYVWFLLPLGLVNFLSDPAGEIEHLPALLVALATFAWVAVFPVQLVRRLRRRLRSRRGPGAGTD